MTTTVTPPARTCARRTKSSGQWASTGTSHSWLRRAFKRDGDPLAVRPDHAHLRSRRLRASPR